MHDVSHSPGDFDIRPAGLLVLLHDDPLGVRLLRHRARHVAAVGGLEGRYATLLVQNISIRPKLCCLYILLVSSPFWGNP